jgi:hypothetical protein
MFPKRGFDFGKYSGLFFDELAHAIDLAARGRRVVGLH